MKYVVLVGDGMGDFPLPELGGRTILEAARTPNLDDLARGGRLGVAQTVPQGCEPGSDVANMSILGYDPLEYHSGRGPLEAASQGVKLAADELAFRLNFVTLGFEPDGRIFMRNHAAGNLPTPDGKLLLDYMADHLPLTDGQRLYPGVSYRHLLVWPDLPDGLPTIPPHDYRDQDVTWYLERPEVEFQPILKLIKASWPWLAEHPINQERREKGLPPANSIWPWGQGRPPNMPTYRERFSVEGAVVSAVDLIKGLGVYAGLTPLDVPGATGLIDTNYEGKVAAALSALNTVDFVLIHNEAPDEAGHQGEIDTKIDAVEFFDQRIVGPMRAGLEKIGEYRLLVLCDHFTPIALKTHSREPVPFILFPTQNPSGRVYTEAEAAAAGLYLPQGHLLPNLLFGKPV